MPGLRHFALLIVLFVGAFVPPAAAEAAHPPPSGEMVALEIVALDGEIEGLDVTAEHPFWVRDEGWIEAGDLLPGDELFTSAGGWARVSGATWAEVEVAVYNLDVEGWDSYFVGEGGYWVHNADCPRGLAAGGGANIVYRGLAAGENPAAGLIARAPDAANSVASHVAGARASQWISTTRSLEVATSRFGQNGVVAIDLSRVGSPIVDLTRGIPGIGPNTMLTRWAINAQEVLIQERIPAEAIVPLP